MVHAQFKSTVDVSLIQSMGGDHMIVAAAKVSTTPHDAMSFYTDGMETGEFQKIGEDNAGLINYLMQHRHGTPFEHSALTFFVHAPIFVWREWHRHRIGFCLSGRSVVDMAVPSTRDRRTRTVEDLYRSWNHSPPNKIPVVKRMMLRSLDLNNNEMKTVGIRDVFKTGKKRVYRVLVGSKNRIVECSEDHRFYTPDGWRALSEFKPNQSVVTLRSSRHNTSSPILPKGPEKWKVFPLHNGYKVSTHGRVRSYMIKGSTLGTRSLVAVEKKPTKNRAGRAVVSIAGGTLQVSRMVALTFLNLKDDEWVLHRDDNPFNNCVDNLYMGTDADNKYDLKMNGGISLRGVDEKVLNVACIGKQQTYDIEVDDADHNFSVDGVIVHNSYNEESGRYKTLEPIFYLPDRERPMMKVDGWKPGRPKFLRCDNDTKFDKLCRNLIDDYTRSYAHYQENLEMGFDPGLARDGLNVGIYSGCWVTCNPRSLMAFLSLRTHEPTAAFPSYPLYEIEIAARACENIFSKGWPITYAAFLKHGRVAP